MEIGYDATLKVSVGTTIMNPEKLKEFEAFLDVVEHSFYGEDESKYNSLIENENEAWVTFDVDITAVYIDDKPDLLGEMSLDDKYDLRDEIEEIVKEQLRVREEGFWITVTNVDIKDIT